MISFVPRLGSYLNNLPISAKKEDEVVKGFMKVVSNIRILPKTLLYIEI